MSHEYFPIPDTFGGLEKDQNTISKSRVVILPIPLEKTTSYGRGTEFGPRAIIDASKHMEIYDEETGSNPSTVGIHTDLSLMKSDISFITLSESLKKIENKVKSHLKNNKFLISLGGEHSITIGIVKAFKKVFKDDYTVVQFDAHADLRDQYEGEKNSHACVMRRLIDDNKIVQAGIRSLSKEEADFIKKKKLKINWASDGFGNKLLENILKEIKTKNIYITFDLDFLDPSIMPAVGTPEPGGCGYYEAISLLRGLIKKKNLIGIDFNELAPLRNKITHPEFLASKLVYKTIAYKFLKEK